MGFNTQIPDTVKHHSKEGQDQKTLPGEARLCTRLYYVAILIQADEEDEKRGMVI